MSTTVVVNGNTYVEPDDFDNYGYRVKWFELIGDMLTVVGDANDTLVEAQEAITTVESAVAGTGTNSTSTTSLAVSVGSKSFTVQTGKSYVAGMGVKIARTSAPLTTYMTGTITSYNAGTGAMVVDIDTVVGSGTYTDWSISFVSDLNGVITLKSGGEIAGSISNGDYVIGYINSTVTLTEASLACGVGTATVTMYLSPNRTSASGTAITGGAFSVSTTVDKNTLTGNNTVAEDTPRYLVAVVASASSLANLVYEASYTKGVDA